MENKKKSKAEVIRLILIGFWVLLVAGYVAIVLGVALMYFLTLIVRAVEALYVSTGEAINHPGQAFAPIFWSSAFNVVIYYFLVTWLNESDEKDKARLKQIEELRDDISRTRNKLTEYEIVLRTYQSGKSTTKLGG